MSAKNGSPNINASPGARPNFILINVDNMGYGDAGCYGSTSHDTPRLDEMAKQGVRFTDFYVTSGVCTPSRASLLTGCYAQRIGMHENGVGYCVLFPISARGLHPEETTVARLLGDSGYETKCIGKWHLGDQPEFLPTRHGFDSYFGIPYSEDMKHTVREGWPLLPLMRNEEVVEAPADLETITERYTEEAVEFIKANSKAPFFLYLAHATPGSERTAQVSRQFGGTSRNGAYGDSIHEIDWSTGRIIDTIDELGLASDTLIVFTSDNGAVEGHGGSNLPLGGWGYSTKEGGMREPFIVRWKDHAPAGSTCSSLATALDILPTFCALAGVESRPSRKIDGFDITSLIYDPETSDSPYQAFFYYQVDQLQAVRTGRFKLRLEQKSEIDFHQHDLGPTTAALFDVVADPAELVDLSEQYPDVVAALETHAELARRTLGDRGSPGSEQRPPGEVDNPTPRLRGSVS